MRKIGLFAFFMIFILNQLSAQVPNIFKYQAVVRNSNGEIVGNKLISLKLSILQNSAVGTPVYSETFDYTTNEYGVVAVNIGTGTVTLGTFTSIDWGAHSYYLQVDIDITGGTNYKFMGASQILAVPYAMYAIDVKNNNDADADPTNEIQDLQLVDNILTITKNSGATPISLAKYIGVDTDQQTLSSTLSGNTVTISIIRGNSINFDLPTDFVSKANGGTFGGQIHATNFAGSGSLSLGQNFTLSGSGPLFFNTSGITTLNTSGPTTLLLPTTGTLATIDNLNASIASSNTLPSGNIWVGNGVNVATAFPANGTGQILIGNGSGIGSFPISGEATMSTTGYLTLSNTGVVPGTYFSLSIDSKGRVYAASNPTTLLGFGITDGLSKSLNSGNIFVGNALNLVSEVTMGGDATINSGGVLSLSNTGVLPGTYRSLTVDAKGRISNGTTPTTLAGYGITDAISTSLNNANILIGNSGNFASQVIVQGDASLANNGFLTLNNTTVIPGTYKSVTVDSKGRITSGSNPTTISGYGITDAFNGTWASLTGTPTTVSGYGITNAMTTAHAANAITSANITDWSTAFGWGNHAGLYRPITYVPAWTEITSKPTTVSGYGITDAFNGTWASLTGTPTTVSGYGITNAMTTSHAANTITSANITDWSTAFGWGNHAGLYRPITYVPAWTEITGKPTTVSGYGITDAFNGTWASLTGTPTTVSGYGITNAMTTAHAANAITSAEITNWNAAFSWGDHASAGYEIQITPGTTAQYWRGDKTWQSLDASSIGLGNVENTALSTWTGATTITSVGKISAGEWNAGSVTSNLASFTTVNISDIIHLQPITLPLVPANNGDICFDGTHIYCGINGIWVQLD